MQPRAETDFLRCIDDKFTPVRDLTGALIGCVPRVPDNTDAINHGGQTFELRIAAQVCVCVDLDRQTPAVIDGFIPWGNAHGDPLDPTVPAGEDPDIAVGV